MERVCCLASASPLCLSMALHSHAVSRLSLSSSLSVSHALSPWEGVSDEESTIWPPFSVILVRQGVREMEEAEVRYVVLIMCRCFFDLG